MMPRISCSPIAKLTWSSARTPPKLRVIWSAVRIGAPIRLSPTAFMPGGSWPARHVPDPQFRLEAALAAVLEGDLGGDPHRRRARIERLDQRPVALADQA